MTELGISSPIEYSGLDRKSQKWVERLYEYTSIRQEVRTAEQL